MEYLEDYLDTVESLPAETQRNLSLMHDLDFRAQETSANVKEELARFVSALPSVKSDDRVAAIRRLTAALADCVKHGEEKVALATQTYDVIDRHIQRLDDDLQKFEEEQMKGPGTVPMSGGAFVRATHKRKSELVAGKRTIKSGRVAGFAVDKRRVTDPPSSARASFSDDRSEMVEHDFPVDPNEPTYCVCGQVAFGEMIGCDNDECLIEWYHYGCVDLSSPPKGKWYCPTCRGSLRDKRRK